MNKIYWQTLTDHNLIEEIRKKSVGPRWYPNASQQWMARFPLVPNESGMIYVFNPVTKQSIFVDPKCIHEQPGNLILCSNCSTDGPSLYPWYPPNGGLEYHCRQPECPTSQFRVYECEYCNRPMKINTRLVIMDRNKCKHRFCSQSCFNNSGWKQCNACNEVYSKEENLDNPGISLGGDWYCTEGCAVSVGFMKCDCADHLWFAKSASNFNPITEKNQCQSCMPTPGNHRNVTIPRAFLPHSPTFGYELELSSTPYQKKVNRQWNTEWLKLHTPEDWGIHSDGSVTGGWESVTPPFQPSQWEQVSKVIDVIHNQCEVDESCGTHLHIGNFEDCRHRARFAALAIWTQPIWQYFTAVKRWDANNSYCLPSTNHWFLENSGPSSHGMYFNSNESVRCNDRYRKINLESIGEWKTIENRTLEGCLRPQELEIWCRFWDFMWKSSTTWKRPRNCCLRHMFSDLEAPSTLIEDFLGIVTDKHPFDVIGKRKWCNKENFKVRIIKNQYWQDQIYWHELEDKMLTSHDMYTAQCNLNGAIGRYVNRAGLSYVQSEEQVFRAFGQIAQEGIYTCAE